MISSEDGVSILRNWKRAKTILRLFTLLDDVRIDRDVRINGVTSASVIVEDASKDARRSTFNLDGAAFDRVDAEELPGEVLSLTVEDKSKFSVFLLIRLTDGRRLCFAVPALIN